MTRLKFLALLVGMVLLFAIPAMVSAQPAVHVFVGTVTLDGAAAADGTVVAGWVAGNEVGTTIVAGGSYNLTIDAGPGGSFAGETVSFTIGGAAAAESEAWVAGEATELNLTASSADLPATPEPTTDGAMMMGPEGPTGATGPAGRRGAAGQDGADGADGAPGARGASGADGAAGTAGADGENGAPGARGDKGEEGDDGGSTLAIVALILAIVALVGAGGAYMMGRRS